MKRRVFRLESEQIVPRPRPAVFAFFTAAENLEAITPPFLHFQITTPRPIRIEPGALIDYRLQLFGILFGWRTRIETMELDRRFTDVQVSGPYARWQHLHEFEEVSNGTCIRDVVEYELPFGLIGLAAQKIFVGRALDRIFDYRRRRIAELFGNATMLK